MTISVVVATYRRPEFLVNCLRSLALMHRRPDETIVVARENDAETLEALAAFDADALPVRVVHVALPGLVEALNTGLHAAQSEVVAFLDDDATARPDWLQKMEGFYADENIGAVGGPAIDVRDGREVIHFTTREIMRSTWFGRHIGNAEWIPDGPRSVDFLRGNNMSFRRPLVEAFDVRLKPYWRANEEDIFLPIVRSGRTVLFHPEVIVNHHPSTVKEGLSRNGDAISIHGAHHNTTYVMLKHGTPLQRPFRLAFTFLIGDEHYHGLLWWVARFFLQNKKREIVVRAQSAFRGKCDGVRTFLAWRREQK